ncbi:PTS system D-glucose-specific IIA component (Glc family) /PTS system D-glucose-specific IIB component (Glc family) /PTS system D-glucose-specific IIC component (Glc family) [Scopulibacillus darangshiensis]|uniref:PTS system D-glucose-specific IIA component (Glc family) /PTS system D-glucose-specific IIB component (Glc family) /PTS system D-glucose-specific IIC component (Glc family) n=1 Tax=Scopulibacillus darangshiensis TaxID=442528 RepID=A0A4R2PBM1_9BACL|nr:glucose-specific PTS transporter subunit IIBC [Scopulibacillus darangshiensis]TCP31798.1 PTS system D-glucose-specific IIA component (Glc family) /PTS system D-glucose-specific IIB component (Glc family) /PTS system D-glucose-specific IIC component (Glc family) [Scopulibacillus darangshiensis]
MFKAIFGTLQKVGRALMLPVAILPAAGILMAFGTAFKQDKVLDLIPAMKADWFQLLATVMENAGGIVFDNLALLFAVGVAIGLAGGDGVAGLAAIVGYLMLNVTMGTLVHVTPEMAANNPAYAEVLGIPTLQTGVFGGIIMGIVAALLYDKFFKIELPQFLGFFAGKRFVPIVTAFSAIILGIILIFVWPPIQDGLDAFSNFMLNKNPTLAAFIFGVVERALIPFGLHHIWYSPFWFEFGSYKDAAGQIVHGDQAIFFAQIKDNVKHLTAGTFMTGKFPFMMFGLPAAALAIYHEARPEHKKYVAGIMGSAALTSFLTGITEPIEFSFLFVAPVLFGIHCIFAGLSFMTMQLLNVKIGMTFSGGAIDFLLFGVLPNKTSWWLVIPVGLVLAVIYYFGFRLAIRKFNLKTPGREVDGSNSNTKRSTAAGELPGKILDALGGAANIKDLDACITRLRVQVNDVQNVEKEKLKQLGASGVLEVGNNVQAIFGPRSENLKGQIQDIMSGKTPIIDKSPAIDEAAPAVEVNASLDNIAAPAKGELVPLSEVPDQVFSEKMMGDGFAVRPEDGLIGSPVDGKIINVFPTKHAIGILTDNGREILVHVGIDTVKLNGEGFKAMVKEGDKVKQGDTLLKVDLDYLEANAPSTMTPVIFTNLKDGESVSLRKQGPVSQGEKDIITIQRV